MKFCKFFCDQLINWILSLFQLKLMTTFLLLLKTPAFILTQRVVSLPIFQFLTNCTLGKNFSRRHFETFNIYFLESRIWHFNRHEVSDPIFGKNKKTLINLSSAKSAHSMVSVNYYINWAASCENIVDAYAPHA